jgi:hypothetical protein
MALNSFAQQDTVNPEAIQPRFLNDDEGKLGFEGVLSKTIDAPYAPGNRGLWRKAKSCARCQRASWELETEKSEISAFTESGPTQCRSDMPRPQARPLGRRLSRLFPRAG